MRPATTLHHVRTLHRAGFIALDAERPGPNGITEKPYRDTEKSWTLNVSDATPADDSALPCSTRSSLRSPRSGGRLESTTRQALNLNPSSLQELTTRLGAVLNDFEGRNDADGDRLRRLLGHPPTADAR